MAKVAAVKRSLGELEKACEEVVSNATALHPDQPATNLVATVLELADAELLAELDQILRSRYFLGVIRTVRLKGSRDQQRIAWLFSGLRDAATQLPARVPIADGKKKPLADLNFEDLKRYLKVLNSGDRERHANNAKILAVKALMKLWPARTKKTRGLTLKELDAKKAGY